MNNKIKKYSDYKPIEIVFEHNEKNNTKDMLESLYSWLPSITENNVLYKATYPYGNHVSVHTYEKLRYESPFSATLQFKQLGHKRAILVDKENNYEYSMTTTDFENLLLDCEIPIFPGAKWTCDWFFRKVAKSWSLFHVPSDIEK